MKWRVQVTDNNISVGSVVKLKSGGPIMTVIEIEEEFNGRKNAYCTWYAQDIDIPVKYRYQTFPIEALRICDEDVT